MTRWANVVETRAGSDVGPQFGYATLDGHGTERRGGDGRGGDADWADGGGSDGRGSDGRADGRRPDGRAPDERGSDERGSDERGSDGRGSDGRGSDGRADGRRPDRGARGAWDFARQGAEAHAAWDLAGPIDRPGRRRGRAVKVVGLAVAVVLLTAAVGVVVSRSGSAGDAPAATGPATSTAKVTRQDLVARTEVDGTLGYQGEMAVMNHLQGTVTTLPKPGTVVERGQTLYSVANRPVPLLYGDLPAWRRMAQDVDGPDAFQLEQNLVAMGHASESEMLVDGKFTAATTTAVKRWQKAMGVDQTGVVELGEAVFLPGALRVADVKAEVGGTAPPGAQVLSGTSTNRVVVVDLDATRQSLAKVGDKVEIKLPNGQTTPATIAEVSTVARAQGQGESSKRVIAVTVTPDDASATGSLDQAPVKVGITSDRRESALAVPVNALLALAEGGYGVRVADGTPTGRIVAVTTGLFARGLVEITGDGLTEGTDVEVPAS